MIDDDIWERQPTALEAAHFNDLLKRTKDREARRAAAEVERKKVIFGECLLKLVKLGMPEGKARAMLGKWRGQVADDARLIDIIEQAHRIGTPDPISYVTKAIVASVQRVASVQDMKNNSWVLLGWEQPRKNVKGARWRGSVRAQVWRDSFGKTQLLPPPDGTVPPTLDEDPGVEMKEAK